MIHLSERLPCFFARNYPRTGWEKEENTGGGLSENGKNGLNNDWKSITIDRERSERFGRNEPGGKI